MSIEEFALLNAVWAATIVVLEVPSGAVADVLGRTRVLQVSGFLMVVEMILLMLAPSVSAGTVFWLLLANRVVSGAAEAMASGADEALAYDSLVAVHFAKDWERVLAKAMRYQSAAFIVAMLAGGYLYDLEAWKERVPGWLADVVGNGLPVVVTFVLACGALLAALGMKEPGKHVPLAGEVPPYHPLRLMWKTGVKVLTHPAILVVLLFGLWHDGLIRMVVTLSSEYYRTMGIAERYYGVIGAGLAVMGLVMPWLGQWMTRGLPKAVNLALLGGATLWVMCGVAGVAPGWKGLAWLAGLMGCFQLLNYMVSIYLNREAESRERATLLSFRGLAYNIGFGVAGVAYGWNVCELRKGAGPGAEVFRESLGVFPWWLAAGLVLVGVVAVWQLVMRVGKAG